MIIALFGLPRKKSAGLSYRPPLHGDIFFADQSSVDEFVQSYTTEKKKSDDTVRILLVENIIVNCIP